MIAFFPVCSLVGASIRQGNLGFELRDLSGWSSQGNVEVLTATNFAPNINPPEGQYFALLSTGPSSTSAPDGEDWDGDGNEDNDITVLRIEFISGSGTLSFHWCWLTAEENAYYIYDDFFLVRLDGNTILSGSVDKSPLYSPFPNVPTDDVSYSVTSTGPTSGSLFGDGRSGFQVCSVPIESGGHIIEFIVADAGDTIADSGLLIDALDFPAKTHAVGGYLMAPSSLELLMPLFAICSVILASLLGAVTLKMRRRA